MQLQKEFLAHFGAMMGPQGLYQHATIRTPLLSEGYCTDDNARAIQMLVRLTPLVTPDQKPTVEDFFQRRQIHATHCIRIRMATHALTI